MQKLEGRSVLVTAGAQGIGKAIAERCLDAGANVTVTWHTSEKGVHELENHALMAPGQFCSVRADLTKRADADAAVAEAAERFGGLQILVNNAGSIIARRRIEELDDEFVDRTMDLNVSSMIRVTQAAIPHLQKAPDGASIVNIASLAGRKGGHAGSIAYSTAKGAVITWTRHAATELAHLGIRVNCVAPGLILGTSFHATHTTPASADKTVSETPLGRAGAPDDVSRPVVFLASEYDGYITGITIDINGGVYAA